MKSILHLCLIVLAFNVSAQEIKGPYKFTTTKNIEGTETKDQCRTGTCWSFATTSFIESELIRIGKGKHDISEMFNVRVTYPKKAWFYMRAMGKTQFGPGSLSHDVINAIEEYGMVPESVYPGLQGGSGNHDHEELDAVLEAFVKALSERQKIGDRWDEALAGILDAYLGEYPENFEYQGKKYSPASFRDEMGIKADDYMNFSSFSHVPFFEEFVLEVPDNFSRGSFINLPIEDLFTTAVNAISKGYTVSWDADVSEKGFSFKDNIAIYPERDLPKTEMFKEVVKEAAPTQESRQAGYDSKQTTDDHLMHITGLAHDQNGTLYFLVKNSWGTGNEMQGYQYVSETYFKMKTIAITLHKEAVPSPIIKSLKK